MVYYPDLNTNSSEGVIRIGWLDRDAPFSQGVADPEFVERLKFHYNRRVRQSRGFHECPFCEESRFGLPMELNEKTLTLGSAEIEIKDNQGRVFVAPDLLYHYITEHHYLPPREFIEAVCT
jgi:hypothetical protein